MGILHSLLARLSPSRPSTRSTPPPTSRDITHPYPLFPPPILHPPPRPHAGISTPPPGANENSASRPLSIVSSLGLRSGSIKTGGGRRKLRKTIIVEGDWDLVRHTDWGDGCETLGGDEDGSGEMRSSKVGRRLV